MNRIQQLESERSQLRKSVYCGVNFGFFSLKIKRLISRVYFGFYVIRVLKIRRKFLVRGPRIINIRFNSRRLVRSDLIHICVSDDHGFHSIIIK